MRGGVRSEPVGVFSGLKAKRKKMKNSNTFSGVEAAPASCAPAANPSQGSDLIQTEIPAQRLHRFDCFILLFALLSFLFFCFVLCGAEQLRIRTERSRSGPGGQKKKKKSNHNVDLLRGSPVSQRERRLPSLPCVKLEDERLVSVRSVRSRFLLLRPR